MVLYLSPAGRHIRKFSQHYSYFSFSFLFLLILLSRSLFIRKSNSQPFVIVLWLILYVELGFTGVN